MAQKVQVVLVDDIDGGSADETVTFALDGVAYEIDLTTANAARPRDAPAPWVGSGRRVGGRARPGRPSPAGRRARRPSHTAAPRPRRGPGGPASCWPDASRGSHRWRRACSGSVRPRGRG